MTELLIALPYLIIGGLLGATLNYFQFGFSSSFRSLIVEKNTLGFRALLWMLGLAIILFSPLLAMGNLQQHDYMGFIRPLSLAIPIGAFLFGIGMQIGCGCTSGTLNRVGQLQPLSFTTLIFMILGGTIAAYSFNNWQWLPALEPFAFQLEFGYLPGLVIQLIILFTLYQLLVKYERKKTGSLELITTKKWQLKGAHPFLIAALLLAVFNALLLFVTGRPWSISSVFPLWGTSFIEFLDMPLEWRFWDYSQQNTITLNQGVLENTVSLTTIGVILGALLVSVIHPRSKIKVTSTGVLMSIFGGTIMGFGAVMASGCNIGAFFSGVSSGSLHGWVWLIFALLGNILGLKVRAQFIKKCPIKDSK